MPLVPNASNFAGRVDALFLGMFAICLLVLLGVTGTIIYFLIRYNRKRHPKGVDIRVNVPLEVAWTVIPIVLFLGMFYYGWSEYAYERDVPANAMSIDVIARQWVWSFRYPNRKVTDQMYVALNKPVRLNLISVDVIHGFYVPAFRLKEDVVPGKGNYTWFTPTMLGSFDIQCTVICGVGHAHMLSKVVVLPVKEFERWYFSDQERPAELAALKERQTVMRETSRGGQEVLQRKGCLACHTLDGKPSVGPTFDKLYGSKVTLKRPDGTTRTVTADEAYLTRAIQQHPQPKAEGYPHVMPVRPLDADELRRVLQTLKDLR